MKEKLSFISLDYANEVEGASLEKGYELPDGYSVFLREERYRCGEINFNPSLAGIEELSI